MVFDKGVEHRDWLEIHSWREWDFYLHYLETTIGVSIRENKSDQIQDCEEKINQEIKYLKQEDNKLNGLIRELREAFQGTQLSSDKFAWFDKKNERLCNWVWCFLNQKIMNENDDSYSTEPFVKGDNTFYAGVYTDEIPEIRLSIQPFSDHPSNVSERLASIKKSFENGEAGAEGQSQIIELIKLVWEDVYLNKYSSAFVNWLDSSNQAQCEWAWDYFQGIDNRELRSFFLTWIPHDDKEKAAAMIAAVDMGVLKNLERTELFLSKMKRAWSQKKFRDKSDGKKAYSINMTLKTKKRLDELAEHHDLKLNEVIAKLIKKEHDLIGS